MHVLIDKGTNKLVGQCGLFLQTVENIKRLEIDYSILAQFWNKGYATESVAKYKTYAFIHSPANSLISIVHIDNISSEKVALKNGMLFENKKTPTKTDL